MKYVAYRVENGVLENMSINYKKWCVKGQKETDLNWKTLFIANTEKECEEYAKKLWEKEKGYFIVYNTNGYSYEWSNVII